MPAGNAVEIVLSRRLLFVISILTLQNKNLYMKFIPKISYVYLPKDCFLNINIDKYFLFPLSLIQHECEIKNQELCSLENPSYQVKNHF